MKSLEVRLSREPGQERVVGQLAEAGPRPTGRRVVFEYDPAFLVLDRHMATPKAS